jgi:hypothetical protein
MTKKTPVGTVVEFAADYEDWARNMDILHKLTAMYGPPGCQLGRRWYRRNVRVWRLTEQHNIHGSLIVRNVMSWVMRLYFRNPADATMVQLKFR